MAALGVFNAETGNLIRTVPTLSYGGHVEVYKDMIAFHCGFKGTRGGSTKTYRLPPYDEAVPHVFANNGECDSIQFIGLK